MFTNICSVDHMMFHNINPMYCTMWIEKKSKLLVLGGWGGATLLHIPQYDFKGAL